MFFCRDCDVVIRSGGRAGHATPDSISHEKGTVGVASV